MAPAPPVGVPGAEAVAAPNTKGLAPAAAGEGAPNGLAAAAVGAVDPNPPTPPKEGVAELVVEPNWKGDPPPGVEGVGLFEATLPNWNGDAGVAEGEGAPKGEGVAPPKEGADIV